MPWNVPAQLSASFMMPALSEDLARDPLHPLRHLGCRAARERHEQDPARVRAANDEVGDAVSKRVCFAGSCTGNDQEGSADMTIGADAVLDGSTLLRIERFEI